MTRFVRTWVYGIWTTGLIGLSAWLQAQIHSSAGPETGFRHAVVALFLLAFCLVGVTLYLRMTTARERPEIKREIWLGFTVGLALLCVMVVCFVLYGNLPDTFPKEGYIAANLLIVVLSLLPLPFVVRTDVLALTTEETPPRRRIAWCVGGVVTLAYILLIACGGMLRLLTYVAPVELS